MNKRPTWLVFVLLIGIVLSFRFNRTANPSAVYIHTPASIVIETERVATVTPYPTTSPVPTLTATQIATAKPQSMTETLRRFNFLECLISIVFLLIFFAAIILIFRIFLAIE